MANEWWVGPGRYDFSEIDAAVNSSLAISPHSMIGVLLWAAPPLWWNAMNPDEVAKFNNGKPWDYYTATPTFSSPKYLKEAAEALRAFVTHCEKNYGSRILWYCLCNGVSFESQGWGCHQADSLNLLQDYSPAAQRDFRRYLETRYPGVFPASSAIPSFEQRFAADNAIFRNPKNNALAIAYDRYYSDAIADCINSCARAIKDASQHRKLVGTYYGYTFEYGNLRYCVNSAGHNSLARVLACPDVDFIMSPPSYGPRGIGYPGADMKAFKSIADAGKLSILEDDARTDAAGYPCDYYQAINPDQTREVMRRNYGLASSRLQPICLLPLEEGNEFNTPDSLRDIRTTKLAGQYLYEHPAKLPQSEIAVVIDEDAMAYLSPTKEMHPVADNAILLYNHQGRLRTIQPDSLRLTGDLYYWQRTALSQIGAPTDYLLQSDVDKNIGKYKFWVFLNAFRSTPQSAAQVERLRQSSAVVLWLYAPGLIGENDLSVDNMTRLTGFRFKMLNDKTALPLVDVDNFADPLTVRLRRSAFGVDYALNPLFCVDDPAAVPLGHYRGTNKVALAVKRNGTGTTVFCGTNRIPPELLQSFARAAGVHIYSDTTDNLFAGNDTLTIHSNRAGIKRIRLPAPVDVVDVFTGEVLAEKADHCDVKMAAPTTRVFYLGDAASFRRHMGYDTAANP